MNSIKVTFVQPDGAERSIDAAESGSTLMEVGRTAGVDGVIGTCGGACSCATCHVYVDPGWFDRVGAPDDVEASVLDMYSQALQPYSRLSCQIKLRPDLDGLRVTVAPDADQ